MAWWTVFETGLPSCRTAKVSSSSSVSSCASRYPRVSHGGIPTVEQRGGGMRVAWWNGTCALSCEGRGLECECTTSGTRTTDRTRTLSRHHVRRNTADATRPTQRGRGKDTNTGSGEGQIMSVRTSSSSGSIESDWKVAARGDESSAEGTAR
eukprot:840556-Prymnesium_polylepis.1